ncbi:MAG: hypothetical protein WCP34_12580 [Pseudomonadota bacterium]
MLNKNPKTLKITLIVSLLIFATGFSAGTIAGNETPLSFWRAYPKPYYQKSWFVPMASATAATGVVLTYLGATAASVAAGIQNGGFSLLIQTGALGNLFYNVLIYPYYSPEVSEKFTGYGYAAGLASNREPRFLFSYPVYMSRYVGQDFTRLLWQELEQGNRDLLDKKIGDSVFREKLAFTQNQIVFSLDKLNESRQRSAIYELTDQEEENYVALLLMLAQFPDRSKDFVRYASVYKTSENTADSLPLYLAAVAEMKAAALNPEEAVIHFQNAARLAASAHGKEPEVLEPVLLAMIAKYYLGQEYTEDFTSAIRQYHPDHYASQNTLHTGYTLLGDMASSNGENLDAARYYLKSWINETGLSGAPVEKARLSAKLAHIYRRLGNLKAADENREMALDFIKNEQGAAALAKNIESLMGVPQGSQSPQESTALERIIQKTRPGMGSYGFVGPDIPNDKLSNTIALYGDWMEQDERVLFLWDNSPLADGRDGFIVTNRAIYSHFSMFSEIHRFPLNSLRDLTFIDGKYPEARNDSEWVLSFILGEPSEKKAAMNMLGEIVKLDHP